MEQITFQEDGHKYFYGGKEVPCVSDILSHFGISDFSMVNPNVLEAACLFGSNVHKTCELYDKDDLESCDPVIEPYLDGWIAFRKDYPGNFDIIEQPLYSKVWGFAGTPDRVIRGTVIDIKSCPEYVSHKVQTAMYQILGNENFPELKVKSRLGVYLKPSGYTPKPHKDKTDLSIAKSLISIYNFKKRKKLL